MPSMDKVRRMLFISISHDMYMYICPYVHTRPIYTADDYHTMFNVIVLSQRLNALVANKFKL